MCNAGFRHNRLECKWRSQKLGCQMPTKADTLCRISVCVHICSWMSNRNCQEVQLICFCLLIIKGNNQMWIGQRHIIHARQKGIRAEAKLVKLRLSDNYEFMERCDKLKWGKKSEVLFYLSFEPAYSGEHCLITWGQSYISLLHSIPKQTVRAR